MRALVSQPSTLVVATNSNISYYLKLSISQPPARPWRTRQNNMYTSTYDSIMGLLPDTQNCRLRMRRECRERFPPPPISKETAI